MKFPIEFEEMTLAQTCSFIQVRFCIAL